MNVSIALTDMQKQTLGIKPVNSFKKPAALKGVPTFTVDVTGVVSLFPSDDGSTLEIDAIEAGTAVITVDGFSLKGVEITVKITVTVTPDSRSSEVIDFLIDTSAAPVDETVPA